MGSCAEGFPETHEAVSHTMRCACSWAGLLFYCLLVFPGGFSKTASAQLYGRVYPVSAFEVEYALEHPRQIPIPEVMNLEFGLRATPEGFQAPRPVDRTVRMRLSTPPRNAEFSITALQHITQSIVSTFNRRGYNGVIVTVPEIEAGSGRDLREPGDETLTLRIWTGRVSRLSSIADGERFAGLSVDERTDTAAHEWIRERSPVQPGGERGLLDADALTDYAAEVSRHPGRRVEVELEPGDLPGTADVNLRIAEGKPWYVYAQYSNTGTNATTKNRERFGAVSNQLTGRDDILRVDYVTGDFDSVQAVQLSYEAPFSLDYPALRWRVGGGYSEYDASQVGFVDSRFTGDQFSGDALLIWNAWQHREFFLDLVAGTRVQQMHVDNRQFGSSARALYVLPRVGLEAERNTLTSSLFFNLSVDVGVTDADRSELALLGTPDPTRNFARMSWDGSWSAYLEPLIDRQAWEDPSTPGSSTLAHEVAVLFRGQYAFGDRLVPQYQQVAGGFYSVRGYRQAQAAGDDLFLGSLEYRFHLPRILKPSPDSVEVPGMGNFRVRPAQVWGRADWDLIFRVFTDAAHVMTSDANSTEPDETLWSVGAGLELQFFRNLTVRFDAGHVLETVRKSKRGDTRGYVVATLLY